MVSMIPAVATANVQQVLNVLTLFDCPFEQNLVLSLAFLYKSQPNTIRTVVNTTTNLIAVRIGHDFI